MIFNKLNYSKKTKIPIVYSCDNKQSLMALVSMTSVMENTNSEIEFTILHSKLNKASIDALNSIKKYKNCTISFRKIDEAKFKGYKNVFWVTLEAWYRILIPELFPQYNKVVYLDCDTLLNGDILEFYQNDISNVLVGAVKDVWGIKEAAKRTKLKNDLYFNSGVMLINPKKWKKKRIYKQINDYVKNNEYSFGDQDVLNYVIQDDKTILSTKFNYLEGWWGNYKNNYEGDEIKDYEFAQKNPLIIHFTGYKPNIPTSHHSMKELWWKYALKTGYYTEEQKKENLKEIYARPALDYKGAIPLFYITDEENAIYTLTSLVSVLENTKNKINVTIIDKGMSEKTLEYFNSLKYQNCVLDFIKINDDDIPEKLPVLDYLVFNSEKFANDIDKAIYFNNTVILKGDVQELYNFDISDVLTATVQDLWRKKSVKRINLEHDYYFSCGVMLLNFKNLQKANLLDKAIEYKQKNSNVSEQDILNKIINEDKILISPRYNYMEGWWHNYYHEYEYNALKEYLKAKHNPLIINFTGYMPDYVKSRHSYRDLWWQYLKKTNCYIEKLDEFRLKAYGEVQELKRKAASYRNKLSKIKNIISN